MSNYHDIPKPTASSRGDLYSAFQRGLSSIVRLWRPPNSGNDEAGVCTIARVAMRLSTRAGDAYTADELIALIAPYNGEPTAHIAQALIPPEPATYAVVFAGDDNDLTFTAATPGADGNDLMITLLGVGDSESPIDVYLDTVNPGGGVTKVCVDLATGVGDAATGTIIMFDASEAVFEADTAGVAGDDVGITLTLPMGTDPYGDPMITPNVIAVFSSLLGDVVTTDLATTTGVAGRVCVVESFTGAGGLTVQQVADLAGTWGNGTVSVEVKIQPEAGDPLFVTVLNDAGAITITVYLETDVEGIPVLNTDADVITAINAALTTEGLDAALIASEGCAQAEYFEAAGSVGAAAAGNITVTVVGALVPVDNTVAVVVALANDDTPEIWATKVVTALNAEAEVSTGYLAYRSGVNVYLVAKAVAANDATLDVSVVDTDTTGITPVASSTAVNVGVATGGDFNSAEAASLMGVHGVPAVEPVGDDAVNLAADIETSIDAAGAGVLSLATASAGGSYFPGAMLDKSSPSMSVPFLGGGGNAANISTAAEVIDAIAAFAPAAALMVATLTGGDGGDDIGAGVVETFGEQPLTGGSDQSESVELVVGTPAFFGQMATDGTDVWMAVQNDPEGILIDTWKKLT